MKDNKPIIITSTEKLAEAAKEIWAFLPEKFQQELHRHINTVSRYFTEIKLKDELLPDSWKKSDDLKDAIMTYLNFLKNTKKTILTEEHIKTIIKTIYLKVKGDINLAIESYHFSLLRDYSQPYVPNKTATQLTGPDALPSASEVKNALETTFKKQNSSH